MLDNLIDIAKENIPDYEDEFERRVDKEKSRAYALAADIIPSIKMNAAALTKTLNGHWKNRFELCAEAEDMTLDEFEALPHERQVELKRATPATQIALYNMRAVIISGKRNYY